MFTWEQEPNALSLQGELDVGSVETLQEILLNALKSNQSLLLDLHGVVRLDTAAAQVLASLSKEESSQRLKLHLSAESALTIERLGLMAVFQPYLAGAENQ